MKYFFMLLITVLTATAVNAQNSAQTDTTSKASYYCPMHPEVTASKPATCNKCGMKLVKMKLYTCGMHSEVVTNKPGKCPKCGMALVEKKEKQQ